LQGSGTESTLSFTITLSGSCGMKLKTGINNYLFTIIKNNQI
jgi:hypothetical protein